jgi:hypothetical protein
MWKLKFMWVLPPLQLAFAVVAIRVSAYQSRYMDSPPDFFIWQLCRGLNAPARFAGLILGALCNWLGHGLDRGNNWAWGEFYFLVNVGVMWFLIGFFLDNRRNVIQLKSTGSKMVINVILICVGILAFVTAVECFLTSLSWLMMPRTTVWMFLRSNPPLVIGIFSLLWSFILVIFPGRNLLAGLLRGHPKT